MSIKWVRGDNNNILFLMIVRNAYNGKKKFTFNVTKESGKTEWEIKKCGEVVLYITLHCDKSVGMIGESWSATVFGYEDFDTFFDMAID